MPIPLLAWAIIAGAGAGAAQSASAAKASKAGKEATMGSLALEESGMNPFRSTNAQARSLMALDRELNTSPRSIAQNGRFNSLQGGEYRMSPEMIEWLTALRQRVASGQTNPRVTPRIQGGGPVYPLNMNLTGMGSSSRTMADKFANEDSPYPRPGR